jgi:hypothetical protein
MTPTVSHVVFIPAVLLVGMWIGWVIGVRQARAEAERRERERRE